MWPYFARGYEKVLQNSKEKHQETSRLIKIFYFLFLFLEPLHFLARMTCGRENRAQGKERSVPRNRKGIDKETEYVRGVRRACHGKAWMLR